MDSRYRFTHNVIDRFKVVMLAAGLMLSTIGSTLPALSDENDRSLESAETTALSQLETYLQAGDWARADAQTWALTAEVVDVDATGGLITFEHLSCDRLQHIDQLWRTYSQDQFGFSVQKNLVAQNGDDPTNLTVKAYRRLALQTGWKTGTDQEGSGYRRYRSLDFSDAAPQGQFPASPWGGYNYRREFGPFLGSNQELGQRIARCL